MSGPESKCKKNVKKILNIDLKSQELLRYKELGTSVAPRGSIHFISITPSGASGSMCRKQYSK